MNNFKKPLLTLNDKNVPTSNAKNNNGVKSVLNKLYYYNSNQTNKGSNCSKNPDKVPHSEISLLVFEHVNEIQYFKRNLITNK